MKTDFRALCAELLDLLSCFGSTFNIPIETSVVIRARALLAQPKPAELTDEELLKVFLEAKVADMRRRPLLSSDANGIVKQLDAQTVAGIRAVLARWGRPTPQPDLATRLALHPDGTPMVSIGKAAPLSELGRLAADPDHSRSVMSPTPQPPADGEVAELVEFLRRHGSAQEAADTHWAKPMLRAAELLQRFASPACLVINPDKEAIAASIAAALAGPGRIELLPDSTQIIEPSEHTLLVPVLQPVAVAERPWEQDGWCDDEGRCWLQGKIEGDWRLINPRKSGLPQLKYAFSRSLSAHALPE